MPCETLERIGLGTMCGRARRCVSAPAKDVWRWRESHLYSPERTAAFSRHFPYKLNLKTIQARDGRHSNLAKKKTLEFTGNSRVVVTPTGFEPVLQA